MKREPGYFIPEDDGKDYTPLYFTIEEFLACYPSTWLSDMNPAFLRKLDKLRSDFGHPIYLNCAFRSRAYDIKKGRSGESMHCVGRAVDVHVDKPCLGRLIMLALESGFRVGVGDGYVHLDDKNSSDGYPVLWTYY